MYLFIYSLAEYDAARRECRQARVFVSKTFAQPLFLRCRGRAITHTRSSGSALSRQFL